MQEKYTDVNVKKFCTHPSLPLINGARDRRIASSASVTSAMSWPWKSQRVWLSWAYPPQPPDFNHSVWVSCSSFTSSTADERTCASISALAAVAWVGGGGAPWSSESAAPSSASERWRKVRLNCRCASSSSNSYSTWFSPWRPHSQLGHLPTLRRFRIFEYMKN